MNSESVLVAGVGPGLGIAVAARFACEGYRVAMLARSRDRLAELADPVHGRHGVTARRRELRQPRLAQLRLARGGAEHGA